MYFTDDGKVMDDGGVLDLMGREVRAWCEVKGWRQGGDRTSPDAYGRTFGDEMALLHSEISEALEAFRQWGTQDVTESVDDGFQNGKPEGVGAELADVLIRLLDTCEHYGINLFAEYRRKMNYNETRTHRHGGKAL